MNAPVFVDTNVLVYRLDSTEPEKQRRAEEWLTLLWRERRGRVSWQVLNELYVTVTGKLDRPLPSGEARAVVRALLAWSPVCEDGEILETAWRMQDRYSLSWWDALIVAAAGRSQCRILLTEDLQEGQSFDGVVVVNPFTRRPDELG